jgi:(p)ppGpp synthase/HD superfamily hydrolase
MNSSLEFIRTIISDRGGRSQITRGTIAKLAADYFGSDSTAFLLIMGACDESRDTHKQKKRKNGDRVIDHERSIFLIAFVYLSIRNVDELVAIFLHDMHEDYPEDWPMRRIRRTYNSGVSNIVQAVTKPKRGDLGTVAYDLEVIERVIAGGKWAIILKCIDRLHNMLTLYGERDKIVWKVAQTELHVIPMAKRVGCLADEITQAMEEQIKLYNITEEELLASQT